MDVEALARDLWALFHDEDPALWERQADYPSRFPGDPDLQEPFRRLARYVLARFGLAVELLDTLAYGVSDEVFEHVKREAIDALHAAREGPGEEG